MALTERGDDTLLVEFLDCSAGEDEGSFELTIKDMKNKIGLLQLNVFVSGLTFSPSDPHSS